MSLGELSTELDCAIVSFLEDDKRALSAFSKVSKYYRAIAEPHLYQALGFKSVEWESLTRLLLTLIKREDLALHITIFTLDCGTNIPMQSILPSMENIGQDLWNSVSAIRDKLNDVLSLKRSSDGTSLAFRILSQLYTTEFPDAVVAVVLCLATNLRQIHLCAPKEWPLRSVWAALSSPWEHSAKRPFEKLEFLSICGCGGMLVPPPVILPPMTHLVIANCNFGAELAAGTNPFCHPLPIPKAPSRPALEDLWLHSVDATPASIQHLISSPWLRGLRGLHVCNSVPYGDDMQASWNLPGMLRALERFAPSLETLEWFGQSCYEEPPVFDTFRNLDHLVYLNIDLHLLCLLTDDECEALYSPETLFPPSLLQLKINTIPCKKLDRMVSRVIEPLPQGKSRGAAMVDVTKAMGSKVPFKSLVLDVSMVEYYEDATDRIDLLELDPMTVHFLRLAADVWITMGIQLQVYRIPDTDEEESHKLLIEPGWTAPAPHSARTTVKASEETGT